MKAIVCEMCGSHDLLKQDGVYVCQHCGTKYTVDEAKKLMIDLSNISDENPIPVKDVGNLENYEKLGWAALEAGNGAEAMEYAKRILEADPNYSNGWLIKFNALMLIQTFEDPHYTELVATLERIRDLAPSTDLNSVGDTPLVKSLIVGLLNNIMQTCDDTTRYYDNTNQSLADLYQSHLKLSGYDRIGSRNFVANKDEYFELRESFARQGLDILAKYATDARMQSSEYQNAISSCASSLALEVTTANVRVRQYGRTLYDNESRLTRAKRIQKQTEAYQKAQQEKVENAQLEQSGVLGNLTPDEYRDLQNKERNLKALELQRKNGNYILYLIFGPVITFVFIMFSMLHFWEYEELSAFQVIMIVCGIVMILRGLFELVDIMTKVKELREEIWKLEDKQNAKKQSTITTEA